MLLLLVLTLAVAQVYPPSKQIRTGTEAFEGFIYPYMITSKRFSEIQVELIFTRLDQSKMLFRPEGQQRLLEENYDLLPDNATVNLESIRLLQLTFTESIILIADGSNPNRAIQVLLRNPHLYLHLSKTTASGDSNHFIGMFQQRDQHTNKLPNRQLRSDEALFAVEELWREFIYVYLFRQEQFFTFFLKRNIIHSNHYTEPYRFMQRYYFDTPIVGMRLVRSTVRDVLHIVLYDADRFCIFSTGKDLQLQFDYCVDEKNIGLQRGLLGFPYDGVMFHRKSKRQFDGGNPNYLVDNRFVIYHLQQQQPAKPTCEYLEKRPVLYFSSTGEYAVYCTDLFCRLLDQLCKEVGSLVSFDSRNYSQSIKNVQLIRYNFTAEEYVSQLMVKTQNNSYRFCLCMNDEKTEEVKDISGKSEFICRKTSPQIDSEAAALGAVTCPKGQFIEEIKDKKGKQEWICRKKEPAALPPTVNTEQLNIQTDNSDQNIHSVLPISYNKCTNLNCFECSMTSHCYYINQQCQLIVGKLPVLYPIEVYEQTNSFEELYSRYLYGQTSSCSDDTLYCTFNKSSIVSNIRMIKYRNPPIAGQYCTIFVPLEVDSRYRFMYATDEHNFNVSVCENGIHESKFGCFERNTSQLRSFEIRGINYMMLYLFYHGNLTTLQDSQHQLQEDYELVNIEEEEIYNATRLFTIVFGSFLLVTIIFIAYILLKSRLMARLALWGVVTFVPSGIYPLSKVELKLKIRELIKKGFLIEYKYEPKQNGKEESRTIEECSFCLEQFERDISVFELYCRHKYHKVCLSDWIRKERNSQKCPICKRGFTEAELIRFNEGSYSYGFSQEAAP